MTVAELIEKLLKLDQTKEVCVFGPDGTQPLKFVEQQVTIDVVLLTD